MRVPLLSRSAGAVSALFGAPMATYTAVLLANTAVPSWHEVHRELPFVFGGSALAAGGGLTMVFTPVAEAGPSRKAAVAGAAVELAVMHRVENEHGIVSEPFHEGRAGALLRAARVCTAAGAGLTVPAGRRRARLPHLSRTAAPGATRGGYRPLRARRRPSTSTD